MAVETIVRMRRDPQRRVSIPKPICDALGIEPGDLLKLTIEKIPETQPESESSPIN